MHFTGKELNLARLLFWLPLSLAQDITALVQSAASQRHHTGTCTLLQSPKGSFILFTSHRELWILAWNHAPQFAHATLRLGLQLTAFITARFSQKINLFSQGIYFMFKVKAYQRNIVNILSESFQGILSFLPHSSSLKHLLLQLLLEMHDLLGQVVLLCLTCHW